MAEQQMSLPTSLLTEQHLVWLRQAQAILANLQYHIDQARRAGVPMMDEHQATLDKHNATIAQFKSVYFPGQ